MRPSIVILIVLLSLSPVWAAETPNVNDVGETSQPTPSETPTSTISRDDAIKEAQSTLKEPGPVRDLSNPGVVYSTLSDGVAAWVSSLGGSRDKYGNEITSSYVSASRPDYVPASLQSFLLNFYKDNPEVGLAFGPEGVTAATEQVQDAYNEQVVELADEIMEEAAAEAAANAGNSENSDDTSDADTSENTPELTDDDQNEGDSDTSDDTGNDDTNDDSGSDGSQLTDVAAIEEKYKVDLQKGDKDFSAAELAAIDTALSSIPSSFYGPMNVIGETENPCPARIKRMSSITFEGQPAYGIYRRNAPSAIEISDIAWEHYTSDYPVPPFTDEQAQDSQFGGTLVHEMFHRHIGTDSNGQHIADVIDKPYIEDWSSQFGWSNSGGQWTVADPSTCVTKYAGMANPEEDMAESVMMYVYWPNKLKAVNQAKYDFIKNVVGVKESSVSVPYPG